MGDMKAEKRFFIIGDMLELGAYAEDEHRRILQEAAALGIRGIAVGEHFKALENEFDTIDFCLNNDEAKLILDELKLTGFTILIKGSRGIRLEELAKIL